MCASAWTRRGPRGLPSSRIFMVLGDMKAEFVRPPPRDLGVRGASIVRCGLSCLVDLNSDLYRLRGSLHGLDTFWARGLSWINKETTTTTTTTALENVTPSGIGCTSNPEIPPRISEFPIFYKLRITGPFLNKETHTGIPRADPLQCFNNFHKRTFVSAFSVFDSCLSIRMTYHQQNCTKKLVM